jgi:biopolymer transport protein ExbB
MKVYSLEDGLADLKTKKFNLEEELNILEENKGEIQNECGTLENIAKEIRNFINEKKESLKRKNKNNLFFVQQDKFEKIDSIISFSDLLNFLEKEISEAETLKYYRDKVDGQEVELLKIGNAFAVYRANDGKLGLWEKNYKKGKIVNRWNKNLSSSLRKELKQMFIPLRKKDKGNILVPMDIIQGAKSKISEEGGKGIIAWIIKGGPVMIPIAFLLLGIIIMSVERLLAFRREHTDADLLMNKIMDLWKSNDKNGAIELCLNTPGPVARMLKIGLEQQQAGRQVVEEMFHEQHLEEIPRLQKNLSTIGVLAGVAPLLGLLGTVSGMISTFKIITYHGGGDPRLLAGGISEALITTEAGLIIAIPALLIHNYLSDRAEKIAADMEKNAVKFINSLCKEKING